MLLDFNPAYEGVVFHRGKLDYVLAAAVGIQRKLFDHRLVPRSGRSKDIEVG